MMPARHQARAIAGVAAAACAPCTATVAVYDDPLAADPTAVLRVSAGRSIASLLPLDLVGQAVVCRYRGVYILRADWARPVLPGDIVEFRAYPQGGGNGSVRQILSLAILLVAWEFAPYLTGNLYGVLAGANTTLVAAGLIIGGNLALNALLPVAQPQAPTAGPAASPSYNVALSGNSARLDGAIPVLYGFNRTFPDFSAPPYVTFDNATSDQYYHVILCIGHGRYTIGSTEIDDTPISTYADVEINVLEPGDDPSIVEPAVTTAAEVTGQELMPGRYVGAFAASKPRQVATHLEFDVALQGLGKLNSDGSIAPITVQLRFEARPINDWGDAEGAPWIVLGTQDITAATVDAVRRSFRYALTTPGRYLARAVRTTAKDTSTSAANEPHWVGLKAVLSGTAPDTSTTRVEIRMRASEQLNGYTQRKIAVRSLRKLNTWSPETGWSAEPVETRNPAWALADKWKSDPASTVARGYGDGLSDDDIDLPSLYALAQLWDERQDRCDVVFDSFTDTDSADQLIANTGRAKVIERNGRLTVVRDGPEPVPVTMYSPLMMRPGSWGTSYGLATSDSPDGLILEYWDHRVWDWAEMEIPVPGRSATDPADPLFDAELPPMRRPIRQRVLGVIGQHQVRREGLYMAAKLLYRRNTHAWQTELQGMLPSYGRSVYLAPALPSWGVSGDVVAWDVETLTLSLSEPVTFTVGADHYIILQRDVGSVAGPYPVAAVDGDAYAVQLTIAPDCELVCDSADRERPRYTFGTASASEPKLAKILGIRPAGVDGAGAPQIELQAVVDDDRVHDADAAWLPVGEEVQDPVHLEPVDSEPGGGGGAGGGSTLLLTSLTDRVISAQFLSSASAAYSLMADGRARQSTTPGGDAYVGSEWLLIAPTTTADTGLFECRATVASGTLTSGTTGTWQSLDNTRTWTLTNTTESTTATVVLDIEIRDAETDTVQSSCTVTLQATADASPGGGD